MLLTRFISVQFISLCAALNGEPRILYTNRWQASGGPQATQPFLHEDSHHIAHLLAAKLSLDKAEALLFHLDLSEK